MAKYTWVRFNALDGTIIEKDLKVADDSIKTDINGYDEISLSLPAYGLKSEDRLKWANDKFSPWKFGVALVDTDSMTVLGAGLIVKSAFTAGEERIEITAYNVMEYFKKLFVPARYTALTNKNATHEWTGASWGEVYGEIIRSGISKTGLPSGTTVNYPTNLQLTPRSGGGKSYKIFLTEVLSAYDVITALRDSYITNGEEVVFDAGLTGSGDILGSKVIWIQKNGTASSPHINAGKNIAVTKASTIGDSGSWKVAEYNFDSDATGVYNRLIINGSSDSESPKIVPGGSTAFGMLTLAEYFDSGTDLNSTQMTSQMNARLTGSMSSEKDISLEIVDDENNWWLKNVGRLISIFPGIKTAGAAAYGRVTEISYTSSKPGSFTLSVSPTAARYPKLPSQKKREDAGLGDKKINLDNFGGSIPDAGDLNPWDASLDPGLGGTGDIFPGELTPGIPEVPDFGDGGFGPTITLSGIVYDMYRIPFEGVTVTAYKNAELTEQVDSSLTDDEGKYTLNVSENGKFWVVASYMSTKQTHPQSPIETEDQTIDEINFTLPTSNPLKLYRVYGKIANPPESRIISITQAQTVNFSSSDSSRTLTRVTCDNNGYFIAWLPSGAYNPGFNISNGYAWGETFFVNGKDSEIGEFYATNDPARFTGVRTSINSISNIAGIRVDAYADIEFTELITSGVTNLGGRAVLVFPENWDATDALYVKAVYGEYIGYAMYNHAAPNAFTLALTDSPLYRAVGKMDDNQTAGNGAYTVRVGLTESLAYNSSAFTSIHTDKNGFFAAWVPEGSYSFGQYSGTRQGTPISLWGMNHKISSDTEVGIQYTKDLQYSYSERGFYGCSVTVQFAGCYINFAPEEIQVEAYTDSAMTQNVGFGLVGAGNIANVSLSTTLNVSSTTSQTIWYRATWRGKTVSTSASAFLNAVTVTFTEPTYTISGTVYTAAGTPQASGSVLITKNPSAGTRTLIPTSINSAGFYSMTVVDGQYTLTGQGTAPIAVTVSGGNVTQDIYNESGNKQTIGISLTAANIVVPGTVRLYSDSNYTNLIDEYFLNSATGVRISTSTTGQSSYSINVAKYPNLWIEAEYKNIIVRDSILNITATQSRGVQIEMETLHTISGTVYTAAGTPQASGSVTLYSSANMLVISLTSPIAATGEYSFTVPKGMYRLEGQGTLSNQVEVSNEDIKFDIYNEPGTLSQIWVSPSIGGVIVPSKIELYSDSNYALKLAEYKAMLNTSGQSDLRSNAIPSDTTPWSIVNANFTKYPNLWMKIYRGDLVEKVKVPEPNQYGFRIVNASFAETFTVSGTVVTSTGTPVPSLPIAFHKNGLSTAATIFVSALADAQGKYSISLPKGKYNLRVSSLASTNSPRIKTEFIEVNDSDVSIDLLYDAPGSSRAISGNIKVMTVDTQNWEADVQFSLQSDFSTIYDSITVNGGAPAYNWQNSPINTPVYVRARYKGLNYPAPANPYQGNAGNSSTANIAIERTLHTVKGKMRTTAEQPVGIGQRVRLYTTGLPSGNIYIQSSVVDANGNWEAQAPSGTYTATDQIATFWAVAPVVVGNGEAQAADIVVGELTTMKLSVRTGGVNIGNIKITVENEDGEIVFETRTIDTGTATSVNARIMAFGGKILKIHTAKKVYDYLIPQDATQIAGTTIYELPF